MGWIPVEMVVSLGHNGDMPRSESSFARDHAMVGLSLLVVVGGVASVIVRTTTGTGPTTDVLDIGNLLVLALVAAPSLAVIPLTRRWRISLVESLLGILAWAPLLGPAGDTSCVDCAFVLLWPMTVAAVQLSLLAIAWFSPSLRSR